MKPTIHHGEGGGRLSRIGLSVAPRDDDGPSAGAAAPSEAVGQGLPRASPTMLAGARPLLGGLSIRFLRENGIYLYEIEGCARAAIADAGKLPLLEPLAWTLQRELHPELAELDTILSALKRVAAEESKAEPAQVALTAVAETEEETIESLKDLASGAPIVRAVNEILELALERRSTDIHLEPVRSGMRVRIRIDGILTTLRTFAPDLARPIVSRVKILAALNIAERRLPRTAACGCGFRVTMSTSASPLCRPRSGRQRSCGYSNATKVSSGSTSLGFRRAISTCLAARSRLPTA